ncbi:MAG: hypothetical protein ACK5TO_04470 [Planctomycetaceae bacterium]|jgi:hypothetical protein
MDPRTVEALEKEIEQAIVKIVVKWNLKRLPLLPDQRTFHLMAKAAVTVYETAVQNSARQP